MFNLDEQWLIHWMSMVMIATGILTFFGLTFLVAPYGRYQEEADSWGVLFSIRVPARLAWFIQESPCILIPIYLLLQTSSSKLQIWANTILLAMFLIHYIQRSLIYPMLIKGGKPSPIPLMLSGLMFCLFNSYMQCRHLTMYQDYQLDTHLQPVFILGVLLFVAGMAINIHSDHILRNLRKPGETGYRIPHGGMFNYISGANFFGEIVEWGGYALAAQNLPALAFFLFTVMNIGPRAYHHHGWYKEKFREDYPKHRKAIVPFLI